MINRSNVTVIFALTALLAGCGNDDTDCDTGDTGGPPPPCDLPFISPLCDTCSAGYEIVPIDINGTPGISCAALGPVWGNSPVSPFGVYTTEEFVGDTVVTDVRTQMMWQMVTPEATAPLADARAFCDASTYAGFADWRLPYVHELTSLVDFDIMAPDPSLSASHFPGTSPTHYWTYNEVVSGTTGAWMVSFGDATLTVGLLDADRRIRCVRPVGGYAVDASRFDHTTTPNVTVDTWTGLSWQQQSQSTATWIDAKAQCATLELASQSDWRLPSIRELYGLADYRLREPTFDDVAFPDAASDVWWSRTSSADSALQGWVVDFELGSMAVDSVDAIHQVRCVRGD